MERAFIGELKEHMGETVKIQGWLHPPRDQKKMQFLVIHDSTGLAQGVLEKAANPRLAGLCDRAGQSAVRRRNPHAFWCRDRGARA